jgi:hypothetical protein
MWEPKRLRELAERIQPAIGGVQDFSHVEAHQALLAVADDIEQLSVYKKAYVECTHRQLAIERLGEIQRLEEENTMLRKLVNEGRVV